MKTIVFTLALFAVALAAPDEKKGPENGFTYSKSRDYLSSSLLSGGQDTGYACILPDKQNSSYSFSVPNREAAEKIVQNHKLPNEEGGDCLYSVSDGKGGLNVESISGQSLTQMNGFPVQPDGNCQCFVPDGSGGSKVYDITDGKGGANITAIPVGEDVRCGCFSPRGKGKWNIHGIPGVQGII